ncbi:MAG: Ig-like domain-containing protein [Clostridium sp.]
MTELNETTFTCDAKRSDGETVKDGTLYNKDGSVTFTSTKDYNSGVSYYINPATKNDDIIDISDTRGEGFMGYDNGTKDMSAYDYVRVKVTSENEMNCRTYNGNDQLRSAGFPGSSSSETYEGGWIHTDDEVWEAESTFTAGNTVKAAYKTRTVFIPISMLMGKGMNPETLTAIAFCPQSSGVEVTIHRIDFVKVKYDKLVTGIDVKAAKTEIAPGKTTTVTATVTPADATRQIVKWTSRTKT